MTRHGPFHTHKGCCRQNLSVQRNGETTKRDVSQAVQLHLNKIDTQCSEKKVQTEPPFGVVSNQLSSPCHSAPTPTTAQAGLRLSPRSKSRPPDSCLSFSPQKHPRAQSLRRKSDRRRAPYCTSSSSAGLQIHHHCWLCADDGILNQILYGGQVCSPFILLSTNQEETKKNHNKADMFSFYTAPAASHTSKTLHGLSPSNSIPGTPAISCTSSPHYLKLLCKSCRQM